MKTTKVFRSLKIIVIINFVVFTTVFIGIAVLAQSKKETVLYEKDGYSFPYHLAKADKSWKLPDKLNEISGLTCYKKNELAMIQDERGNIYFFNTITGNVHDKIDFSGDGDYEGVEVVDGDFWVLRSDGDLYRVKMDKGKSTKTKKYETELSVKNDTEGLGYDKKNDRLLIACKGRPYIDDKKGKEKKAIYAFRLDDKELKKKPVIKIDLDELKELRNYNIFARLGIDFLSYFYPSKGDVTFQPSGIAIHPHTNHIYILASVGKMLIVCDEEGEFLAAVSLNPNVFIQPEGICFDQEGNLYIANEGQELNATIFKFKPK